MTLLSRLGERNTPEENKLPELLICMRTHLRGA